MQELVEYIKEHDQVLKALGIEPVECRPGYARTRMALDGRQANSVGIAHGGALFSLADLALALAANAHGRLALTLNLFISYLAPGVNGPFEAEAVEVSSSSKVANYEIKVRDADGMVVALCQGLVYKKEDTFPPFPISAGKNERQ